MISTEKRLNVALEKFLTLNPDIQTNINNFNPAIADNLGMSLNEYRQQKLVEMFREYAEANDLDISNLINDLCADNEQERSAIHLQRHKEIAKSLGMDLSEYCKINKIEA